VRASFDDPNLVSCAGLEPVMRLAEQAGLHRAVAERVHIPGDKGSKPAGKVATVVASMITGADSVDDLDVARHGGVRSMFAGVYAPSTLGSFLREFTHGHVRQLHAAGRDLLVGLAGRVPLLPGADVLTFVDVDSMLRRVYGKQQQGVGFGHAKVGGYNVWLRGYNPLVATVCTPLCAPVVAATQLRAGNAGSARGAAWLIAETIRTARACGATGEIVVRADSAFYGKAVIWACRRNRVQFSVTARMDNKIRTACESIPDQQWIDIKYPQAIWDEDEQRWISDAQIAETCYTAFEGTRWQVTARLVVRRVNRHLAGGYGAARRPPSAPGSSTSPPGWPTAPASSTYTYLRHGPGWRPGATCSPRSTPHPPKPSTSDRSLAARARPHPFEPCNRPRGAARHQRSAIQPRPHIGKIISTTCRVPETQSPNLAGGSRLRGVR
jgi:hypothetical protein